MLTSNMPNTEVIRHVRLNAHFRPMISVMIPNEKAPILLCFSMMIRGVD